MPTASMMTTPLLPRVAASASMEIAYHDVRLSKKIDNLYLLLIQVVILQNGTDKCAIQELAVPLEQAVRL